MKNETNKETYLFCDKILTSYVLCINKHNVEHTDCKHIYHALSKLELCRENNDVLKKLSNR